MFAPTRPPTTVSTDAVSMRRFQKCVLTEFSFCITSAVRTSASVAAVRLAVEVSTELVSATSLIEILRIGIGKLPFIIIIPDVERLLRIGIREGRR